MVWRICGGGEGDLVLVASCPLIRHRPQCEMEEKAEKCALVTRQRDNRSKGLQKVGPSLRRILYGQDLSYYSATKSRGGRSGSQRRRARAAKRTTNLWSDRWSLMSLSFLFVCVMSTSVFFFCFFVPSLVNELIEALRVFFPSSLIPPVPPERERLLSA